MIMMILIWELLKQVNPGNQAFDAFFTSNALTGFSNFWQVSKAGSESGIDFQLSKDAGRYLCDFVYYRYGCG